MTNAHIYDQAYQFFQQEAVDFLQTLEDGLLTLRAEQSIPKVHELMRAAHSIKGGAASVNLPGIQKIAHKLEDVFRALYQRQEPLDADLDEALLQAYDCLRIPLMEQIETGSFDAEAAWEKAEPIFSVLEAALGDAMGADFELPTSMELGIDIVCEVFTGDIERGIQRLESVLENPEEQLVACEIRSTAEVFTGIGDLLGLPGFTTVAQQIIAALEAQPQQAIQIGTLAVENLRAAQATVLAGDRTEGGCPSEVLLAFSTGQESSPTLEVAGFSENLLSEIEEIDWSVWQSNPSALTEELDSDLEVIEVTDPAGDVSVEPELIPLDPEIWNLDESLLTEYQPAIEPIEAALAEAFPLDTSPTETPQSVSEIEFAAFDQLEDLFSQVDINQDIALPTLAFDETDAAELTAFELSAPPIEPATIAPTEVQSIVPVETAAIAPIGETAPEAVKPTMLNVSTPQQPARTETMRVELSRLERLNNLVGELVTQENGSLLQSQQLQAKLNGLQTRFQQFEVLSKRLQDWMDKSQTTTVRQALMGRAQPSVGNAAAFSTPLSSLTLLDEDIPTVASDSNSATMEFDALEMDSYSVVHALVQEAVEEMAQMDEIMVDMALITQQSQHVQRQKQQTLKQVRNDLLWSRMIPLGDILQRFPRMVRDLSNQYHKQVSFKQSGTTTLVDKAVLEKLYDPLVHLVRNAFDHGTDTPAERALKDKSAEATIEIRAYYRGNQTIIEVRDDGRGIHPHKVRAAVIEQGLLDAEATSALSEEQLFQYLFAPGFSTKGEVTDISGRGMGLSAVQSQIKALKGSIAIASEMDKGTTFTIRLPLTLNIAKLMVFRVDAYSMAIPVDTLMAIVMAPDQDLQTIQGNQFYRYQEQLIPLFPPSMFANHYPLPRGLADKQQAMTLPKGDRTPLLLVADGANVIALEVDEILTEQELVIKPFGALLSPPPYIYGCTILGDGTLVPVIDGAVLINQWQNLTLSHSPLRAAPSTTLAIQNHAQSILIIDDSPMARNLLTIALQKHGYNVFQAADGKEALAVLGREANIQAVFSDVEMPVMNGFEFLRACRKDHPAEQLPVIMLTSRSSDKHKGIAKLLGANAYLSKPFIERDMIQALKEVLA
jgi:two-component system, chemotaxis family, sensor histidine kinase and response regulator PixL